MKFRLWNGWRREFRPAAVAAVVVTFVDGLWRCLLVVALLALADHIADRLEAS